MTTIDMKEKNAARYSLGKGEVVSSILTGSTGPHPQKSSLKHGVIGCQYQSVAVCSEPRPAQNRAGTRTTLRQDSGKVCSVLVLAVLTLTACASTSLTEAEDRIVIHSGYGGHLQSTEAVYEDIEATGKPVVIDGHLHSADAFYGLALPEVCYTERAGVSLHAISWLGLVPSAKHTGRMASRLPEPVEDRFRASHAFSDPIGWLGLSAEELGEIWPDGQC